MIIPAPDIVRLSSYLSYQRRKQSGALAAVAEKRAAAKLLDAGTLLSDLIPATKKIRTLKKNQEKTQDKENDKESVKEKEKERCGNNSCMCAKVCSELSVEEYVNWEKKWSKCTIGQCSLQFCPDCSYQGELHSLVCKI